MIRHVLLLSFLICFCIPVSGKYGVTKFATQAWCTTYPSYYVSSNFTIYERTRNGKSGFTYGQTDVTLIIAFSNANFHFLAGAGTVTTDPGSDITITSYTITATTITVTITTAASNTKLDAIYFNNIQINAQAAVTGYLKRTGGTMKIDNKTSQPYSTYSLGDLSALTPIAYTSSTSVQTITSSVFSGSADNQIIGVQVTISGTCSVLTVTAFNFSTTGSTNAGIDITAAKLYYTAQTNVFSTTTLFGTFSNPNGAFTISGSQALTLGAGTYYFWLTYNLAATGASVNGDLVDAQLASLVIGGTTKVPVVTNPSGNRQISDNIYYSLSPGTWTTTTIWSRTSGGLSCGCAPTGGAGYVIISHPISLDGSYTVNNLTIQSGGNLTNTPGSVLTVINQFTTEGSGVFTASSSWILSDLSVAGDTASFSSAITLTGSLEIATGSVLQATGGVDISVNGNMIIDGTLALGTSALNSSNVAGLYVDGTGSITGSGVVTFGANKTIVSGSSLIISPVLNLNGITVTNYGTFTMQNDIGGTGTWINAANAVLEMAGSTSSLLTSGTLTASASPNTIVYSATGNQNIKGGTYYHLHLNSAGGGIKSLAAAVVVNGDLQISGDSQLDVTSSNYGITLKGDWINNSTNATPFNARNGTVTFSSLNSILGTGATTFNIVSISSTGTLTAHSDPGKVLVKSSWANSGNFEHNNSDITFDGSSGITGATSVTTFNNVIVNATKSLTLNSAETDLEGDLTINGTLSPNTGVLVFSGSTAQNINGASSSLSLSKVEIYNSSGLNLARPVTITTSLTLTIGIIATSSTNLLTLNTAATSTDGSASSFVSGPMKKIGSAAFVFPIGKGSSWRRLGISATSTSTRAFTAEYFDTPYVDTHKTFPIYNVSGAEYWDLTRNASADEVQVTLYWEDASASGISDCTDLSIGHFTNSSWVQEPATASGTCSGSGSGSITTNSALSSYSPFTFASSLPDVNTLPVELLNFSADLLRDNTVMLKWSTTSEKNNDFFTVEKTKDTNAFEVAGTIAGAGTSQILRQYTFIDVYPYSGLSYYRLKQTDYDGKVSYSKLVAISYSGSFDFVIYPNPSLNENVSVRINGNPHDEIRIVIKNINGEKLYTKMVVLNAENEVILLENLSELLPSGIYVISASNAREVINKKMVIR